MNGQRKMMTMMRRRLGAATWGATLALVLAAGPVAAEVSLHGFVEGGYGVRTATDPQFDGVQDYTMQETRAQLRANAYGSGGEVFVRLDFVQDKLAEDQTGLELREGNFRFTAFNDYFEVKVGRQIMTWGTGDLVFINDLFARDWVSFFIGREMQYLRAPSDVLRLGLYGLGVDADFVWTPVFTPDRTPTGERLSFYSPLPEPVEPLRPTKSLGNGELALRLSRAFGNFAVELYGYRGFNGQPTALMVIDPETGEALPFYPELSVYGASTRGGLFGGVLWLEGGYYDSRQDRDGTDPLIPNSEARYLVGFERQLFTDFTAGLQYYGEYMLDHDTYLGTLPEEAPIRDELRHLLTLRLEKYLKYQTVRLSLFTYWSPSDEDGYTRAWAGYKVSDEVEVGAGANVFFGNTATTFFGQFDKNDNVFARLRYSF
mgnify:CR=1 FL=1